MRLVVGIDTGGTHTDAIAHCPESGQVTAWNKVRTTHDDLTIGIAQSLAGLSIPSSDTIDLVAVSTTLATNAAIEGLGGRVCALLIGYDEHLVHHYGLDRRMKASCLEFIGGHHDVFGEERSVLDEDMLRYAVEHHRAHVDAFALSSYLSVRNPEHEFRAREIVEDLTDLPIVSASDVGKSLDSVRRATTAILNARLIPIIDRLLTAIVVSVAAQGIAAPIAILRGDGSMTSLECARARPVETLLSGPAASIIGGQYLTGSDEAMVLDMGGTTTDIALLNGGKPKIGAAGAVIGDWRTATRAADVRSIGIGGDSRIVADPLDLIIGPERVEPIAVAAATHPSIAHELTRMERNNLSHRLVPVWEFLYARDNATELDLSTNEHAICTALQDGPVDVSSLAQRLGLADARLLHLRPLIARGIVRRIGLTPTDLLHARGEFQDFDVESSVRACRIAARERRIDFDTLLSQARERIICQIADGLLRRAVSEFDLRAANTNEPLGDFLIDRSVSPQPHQDPLSVNLSITLPIVAIGAPAKSWAPTIASRLHTECEIPKLAHVASAIGASAGRYSEQVEFLLRPLYARSGITGYTVHGPKELRKFKSIMDARAYVQKAGPQLAREQSKISGAIEPEIHQSEHSWDAENDEPSDGGYLMETRFTFTATGQSFQ